MAQHFDGPRLVLKEGATKHIEELSQGQSAFFKSKPYAEKREIESSGNAVFKVKFTQEPPERLRYLAYSAINDMRNALDQAICAASSALAGDGRSIENAYFPFADSPSHLRGQLASRRFSDIPRNLHPFIENLQPYPTGGGYEGGDNYFRAFAKLANPNKHQVPLAVGLRNLDGHYGIDDFAASAVIEFRPQWDSEKDELFIARTPPNASVRYRLNIKLYASIAEDGLLRELPVVSVLRYILRKTNSIIDGLEAETSRHS